MANGFLNLFDGDPAKVNLTSGQVLFSKGDTARHFYIVVSGKLQIFDRDENLQILGRDEIVGEMALVDGGLRSASVRAIEDSMVIEIDEKRFLRMVSDTPYFALRVMRVMAERLRAMNDHNT